MILCKDLNILYLDTPKTGSRSICSMLKRDLHAEEVATHGATIPVEAYSFKIVGSVRNPYTRIISQFQANLPNRNLRRMSKKFNFEEIDNFDTFLDFCLFIDEKDDDTQDNDIRGWWSCSKYLNTIAKCDEVIKLENLKKDYNRIFFNTDDIEHKKISRPIKFKGFTAEQLQKINKWAGEDFTQFNYEKIV